MGSGRQRNALRAVLDRNRAARDHGVAHEGLDQIQGSARFFSVQSGPFRGGIEQTVGIDLLGGPRQFELWRVRGEPVRQARVSWNRGGEGTASLDSTARTQP